MLVSKIKRSLVVLLMITAAIILLLPNTAPYSLLYPLKRAQEKLFLDLKPSAEDKADYQIELLNRRLAELRQVVDNRKYDFLLNSSLRYSTTAGQVTELVNETKLGAQKVELERLFAKHQQALQRLLDGYPPDLNQEWKYLQDDINYLKLYLEKLAH